MAIQRIGGVPAGEYDPVQMQFYAPVRTESSGEPKVTYARTIKRHVKVLTGSARETLLGKRQESTGTQVFRVRRDSGTEAIDEAYVGKWRGRSYQITAILYPNLSELELWMALDDTVLT